MTSFFIIPKLWFPEGTFDLSAKNTFQIPCCWALQIKAKIALVGNVYAQYFFFIREDKKSYIFFRFVIRDPRYNMGEIGMDSF